MGRALLIICAGVFVAIGYTSMGINQRSEVVREQNITYAQVLHARNVAHTAIQIGINKINEDPNFAQNHGVNNKWKPIISGDTANVYFEMISGSNGYRDTSVVRVYSQGLSGGYKSNVISLYRRHNLDFVPEFRSALSFATNNFSFTMSGSSKITGTPPSSSKCKGSLPGMATMNETSTEYLTNQSQGSDLSGDPPVQTDTSMSYKPVDELISRLRQMSGTQFISGNYKGDLGTADEPGVFFVEDYAKLTGGIKEGHGILVIRTDAQMEYEDAEGATLDVAGNVEFNGLVIFENAYNFKGRGTPSINGSVLVGNTKDYSGQIDVDISGNLTIQYDCAGEEYAKAAAARTIKTNKFKRLTTYEEY